MARENQDRDCLAASMFWNVHQRQRIPQDEPKPWVQPGSGRKAFTAFVSLKGTKPSMATTNVLSIQSHILASTERPVEAVALFLHPGGSKPTLQSFQ